MVLLTVNFCIPLGKNLLDTKKPQYLAPLSLHN